MSLTSGTRLGPYEVVSAIGAGGMGEVYRATDTKLKRQVAIKILPPSLAADHDRLGRFQREAEVLASLNHPNIAAIHGLEESDGVKALVMELVEGPTLAERIAHGPLPVEEVLPIARQIAEALEAAHEQGIIHRDLKPANIKVRADGTVKVLDFGLAKALDPAQGSGLKAHGDLSHSPTLTARATDMGFILGTAGYMAPEQAKGKSVDKRADIWAFGVVLYEMLTGQRAFKGDDVSEILASVLKDTPSLDALRPTAPLRLVRLIGRCLDRDLKTRLRDIGEARIEIARIEAGAPDSVVMPMPASPATRSASRALAWALATAAGLLAGGLAIPAVRHLGETPAPEMRVEIVTPATSRPTSFALSPDARQIVFVAAGDGVSRLWLRSLATTSAQPLAGTEGAMYPFWSPDGRSIGFFAGGALKRLDLGGGAPQTLAPAFNGYGGTWSADGVIVFAPGQNNPLMRVSATGGDAVAVTTLLVDQIAHYAPHFVSDGLRFVYYVSGGPDTAGVYLGALAGGTSTKLTPDFHPIGAPIYLPSGWLLWLRARTLLAQRLDFARAALTGEPVTVAEGVDVVSAAANGQIAYRSAANNQRQLTWVDRSGAVLGTVGDPGTLSNPRVSPDGRRVVVERSGQGNVDLWLLDGTRERRLTVDAAADQFPAWSPDGAHLAFRSLRSGPGDLYQQRLTSGAGTEERFVSTDQIKSPSSWSADGRFLLYLSIDPKTGGDLWVVPMALREPQGHPEQGRGLAGEPTPAVFLKTPFREAYGAFSPDGRWVAYHSNESGRMEIYVRPFVPPSRDASADKPAGTAGTTAGAVPVSTAGGILPVWRRDGREIFYINPAGAMMAAPIAVTGATVEPGVPVVLFPTRILGGGEDVQQGRQYDVAPDGRFLINTELDTGTPPITLLMNWNPEGKK